MQTFLRLLRLTFPHKILVFTAFISSILFGLFNAISLWIVGSLIGTIMGVDNELSNKIDTDNSVNYYLGQYFDIALSSSSPIDKLKIVCLALLITFILKNIFYYINWVSLSYVEFKIITKIRNDLYSKIQNFPIAYFDKKKTGELLSIMLYDVGQIAIAFSTTFRVFFHEVVNISILLTLIILLSYKLSFIVLITIPFAAFIIMKISTSIKRKIMRSSYKIADITSIMSEKISGIRIVKAFNMTKKEIELFFINNYKYYQLQVKQRNLLGITTPVNDIIGVVLACVLLWYGGQQVLIINSMSSTDFMRFIIFLFALLQPARKLGNALVSVQAGLVGADRAFSVIDIDLFERKNKGLIDKKGFSNNIVFKDVCFKYDSNSKQVLNNINIKINKGEKVALVGSSGAGKTTFINLLLDFYKPTKGEIFIDDESLDKISIDSIRKIISIVPQEAILFNDTIKNNLSYGLDNPYNDKLIIEAAKNANIIDYINSLPDQFETVIGERGLTLSGGQKQRISIGRAILRDPSILVLDEATSSLDSESEIKVQNTIDKLIQDRTVVMIAHRLSTIINADKILVFDNGSIVEQGNHRELYKMNGIYTKLYNLQFKNHND